MKFYRVRCRAGNQWFVIVIRRGKILAVPEGDEFQTLNLTEQEIDYAAGRFSLFEATLLAAVGPAVYKLVDAKVEVIP